MNPQAPNDIPTIACLGTHRIHQEKMDEDKFSMLLLRLYKEWREIGMSSWEIITLMSEEFSMEELDVQDLISDNYGFLP